MMSNCKTSNICSVILKELLTMLMQGIVSSGAIGKHPYLPKEEEYGWEQQILIAACVPRQPELIYQHCTSAWAIPPCWTRSHFST